MLLNEELTEIEHLIEKYDQQNINVSAKGIDWHLDHSLKVITGVCGQLNKSDPSTYQWKFNAIRVFVYTFNFFPRGKGRSPRAVLPPEIILKQDLKNQLVKAKQDLNSILSLPAKSYFRHPYFGLLNLKKTKKFLKLHTLHHLKICRDIIK
jgi:hypothetical protein